MKDQKKPWCERCRRSWGSQLSRLHKYGPAQAVTASGFFIGGFARLPKAPITPNPAEVAEVRWCTLAEMRELTPTFPDDLHFFAEVLPGIDVG